MESEFSIPFCFINCSCGHHIGKVGLLDNQGFMIFINICGSCRLLNFIQIVDGEIFVSSISQDEAVEMGYMKRQGEITSKTYSYIKAHSQRLCNSIT